MQVGPGAILVFLLLAAMAVVLVVRARGPKSENRKRIADAVRQITTRDKHGD